MDIYEQDYLNCLENRRPELEAYLRGSRFSQETAEDATQEAIIEAEKRIKAHSVEGLQDRWQWLKTVAFRKALGIKDDDIALFDPTKAMHASYGEHEDYRVRRPREAGEHLPPSLRLYVDEDGNQHPLVRAAYEQLPSHLRDVVKYVYIEGNTYAQAAAHFKKSVALISKRLNEARSILSSELHGLPEYQDRVRTNVS